MENGVHLGRIEPPEEGADWEDALGGVYQPVNDHHVSSYLVSADAWRQYQRETKTKGGKIVKLTENGMINEVVLATEKEATAYTKWLEEQCRGRYLDEEHWIEPLFDTRPLPGELASAGKRVRQDQLLPPLANPLDHFHMKSVEYVHIKQSTSNT